MSYMSVDLNSLKDIEKKVSSLSKSLEKIKSSLSSTRNNIDSVVRNRSGIDSSISSLIREVGERELIMDNVKLFLKETIKQYEDMEKALKRESDKIIKNNMPKTCIITSILNSIKSIGKKLEKLLQTIARNSILLNPIIGTAVGIIGRILEEKGFIVTNKPTEIVKRDDKGIPILNGKLSYNPDEYNPYVVLLQKRLIELGYGDGIEVNGIFDSNTLKGVNRYKEDYGLWNHGEYEGIVGETTWNHLFNNQKVPFVGEKNLDTNEQKIISSYINIDKAREISKNITAWYECSSGKYVAGNFDGKGMSIGYFQWNLGSGTLQPLLKDMIDRYGDEFDEIFDFIDPKTGKKASIVLREILENCTKEQQVAWADSICVSGSKKDLLPAWYEAFIKLTENSSFLKIQDEYAQNYYKGAESILAWMEEIGIDITTRAYALALDIAVQNGTGVFTAVNHESETRKKWCLDMRNLVIDTINGKETFLTNPDAYTVYSDNSRDYDPVAKTCSKNQYEIVKEMMSYVENCTDENTKKLYYIAAAAAISEFNRDKYIIDVWGRKSVIVNGSGFIRGVNIDFDSKFGLNDDLISVSPNDVTPAEPNPAELKPTEPIKKDITQGTGTPISDPPGSYNSSEKVQYYLSQMGFDIGKNQAGEPLIDGIVGFSTQAAILIYQYSQGLPLTAQADSATLAALEVSAKAGKTIADKSVFAEFVPKPTDLEDPGGGRIDERHRREANPSDLISVGGHLLQKDAAVAWAYLITAAREEGVVTGNILTISSGYRSKAEQEILWNDALNKHGSPEVASIHVAKPGNSEHQTGYAIDFVLSKEFTPGEPEGEYKWLIDNAHKFGFYNYWKEPWHWSYNPPKN